jgi:maltooligosyltrehalose trehalohydrolase
MQSRSAFAVPGGERRERRSTFGAEVVGGDLDVRLWAPERKDVRLLLDPRTPGERVIPMTPESGADGASGYFHARIPGVGAGARYAFTLDDDSRAYPDPASRSQPDGPHGASEVIDPAAFAWTDEHWRGVAVRDRVLLEAHIGTLTREGTFRAAIAELPRLGRTGITLLEVMPLAEFSGDFGWGYDGVDLYAPYHRYGTPDDFRALVDAAHANGIGVILDVVYNHFGPDGNFLSSFSPRFFTEKYGNEWGAAIDFEDAEPVRRFFIENAAYWVRDFHLDGLRLDATQAIHDASPKHVVFELGRAARAAAKEPGQPAREIFLVAENEEQRAHLVRSEARGGWELDALWNDDFHHSARVALTGRREAYYTDTKGTPQELMSAIRWGYLFQGQRYSWQHGRRGSPSLDLPASAFVNYLENHDQVANSADGARVATLTTPAKWRTMTTLLCLVPATPLLFQGQEYGALRPFLYFAHHEPELARQVAAGRAQFLSQFPSLRDPELVRRLPDPADPRTFHDSQLDAAERETPRGIALEAMHRELLRLRRDESAIYQQAADKVASAVLSDRAFVLRFFHEDGDRLLLVNLGVDLDLGVAAEPLLAPPELSLDASGPPKQVRWQLLFSTENPVYGGGGTRSIEDELGHWRLPGESALLLRPVLAAVDPIYPRPKPGGTTEAK